MKVAVTLASRPWHLSMATSCASAASYSVQGCSMPAARRCRRRASVAGLQARLHPLRCDRAPEASLHHAQPA